jgi:hypothetical protein
MAAEGCTTCSGLKHLERKRGVTIKINRDIILPVVLYGCETWSLALRENRRPKVFENTRRWEDNIKIDFREVG